MKKISGKICLLTKQQKLSFSFIFLIIHLNMELDLLLHCFLDNIIDMYVITVPDFLTTV